ncbi:MAG TPA: cell filamentation protein Fic [Myxococcales bacterium]|jgi:Fic family protein|nr:cell filamentation protein Fic [Myxococcales bacterium]
MKTRYLGVDERTEALKDRLDSGSVEALEFQSKFDLSLVYHENALEGIVFTSAELLGALDPSAEASDASQVPVFAEIRNHKAALDLVRAEARNKKSKISVTLMKKLYEMLGAGVAGRDKAVYRKDMPLHRSYFHEIAPPTKIPSLLEKLVDATTTAEYRENHALNQAATVQWLFMQAFPFSENSGKVARLLSTFVLLKRGYLPVIIHAADRQRYYDALRLPVASLRHLLLEAMENSLDNAFKFFKAHEPVVRLPLASGE